jgi:hypothetical protein
VILNGHEYVACQARKAKISFTKEGNCFTHISDAAGLAKIADTLSGQRTIGRLSQACERWIYTTCLCFALDLDEQKRSGFHYQYSNYQVEYSRNSIFEIGGHMDQVFQALIDRSRVLLDLKTVKTILGYKHRPHHGKRKKTFAGEIPPDRGGVEEHPEAVHGGVELHRSVFHRRCHARAAPHPIAGRQNKGRRNRPQQDAHGLGR